MSLCSMTPHRLVSRLPHLPQDQVLQVRSPWPPARPMMSVSSECNSNSTAATSALRSSRLPTSPYGTQLSAPAAHTFLAISAEALWHAGRTREALESVEEGLAVSQRNGERCYDPQLWRLKGELLKMQGKA